MNATPDSVARGGPPQIETDRLVLRPLRLADLGPMHEVYADREVMRYGTGGSASESIEDSERRLQHLIEHQERRGFGIWAITQRDTGAVIGDCGLFESARREGEVELAYRLAKPHWGKGYATEAARAWLAYGFDVLGLRRIYAATHAANGASLRVLEKIGMRRAGVVDHEGTELLLFVAEREADRGGVRE